MKRMLILILTGGISILSACNLPIASSPPSAVQLPDKIPTDTPPADLPTTAITEETQEFPPIEMSGPKLGTDMLWIDNSLLIFVPSGKFIMGTTYEEPKNHPDHPEHIIDQSGFWIYRSEVTNAMYENCVAAEACTPPTIEVPVDYQNPQKQNHPVVGVDWYQAQAYCSWVNGHLPTESQWEKTARGVDGNIFPWGSSEPTCDLLNFNNCVGEILSSGTFGSTTTPIRSYFEGASYYEALDMEGNVYEWAQDWWQFDYYAESPKVDPPGPTEGELKVVRSSSFRSAGSLVPSTLRDAYAPNEYRDDLGFRCVVESPPYYAPACVYTPQREVEDCPPPTLNVTDSYCLRKTGVAEFTVSEGTTVTSSGDSCSETSPDHYICYGASGAYVNVEVCTDCQADNSEDNPCPSVNCGVGPYVLNPETCTCGIQIGGAGHPENNEENSIPGEVIYTPCPPGRYYDLHTESCVPITAFDLGLWFNPDDYFFNLDISIIPKKFSECPPAWEYNEDRECCDPKGNLNPPPAERCESYTLQLGTCETTQVNCENPSQYTNASSCGAAHCSWEQNPNIHTHVAYYCTYP